MIYKVFNLTTRTNSNFPKMKNSVTEPELIAFMLMGKINEELKIPSQMQSVSQSLIVNPS